MASEKDPFDVVRGSISSFRLFILKNQAEMFDNFTHSMKVFDKIPQRTEVWKVDHLKVINGILRGNKVGFDGFLLSIRFARVESLELTSGSGVERSRSELSTVSASELGDIMPRLGCSEPEGRQFFEELDRDGDGKVNLEGLEIAMRKMGLPKRNNWSEASAVVPASRDKETVTVSVLKSALAGGLACSFSAFVMHPLDTMKTCVQASTLSFPELVSKLPEIGLQGLYKGSIPAVLGQFSSSHGLRTGICEASKFILMKAAPTLPEIQVQSLASLCSTILGTTSRLPCEVLKQRLQAGIFDNVGEAFVGTLHQDGIKGFFRGTGAILCREIPFYVAGMGLYKETKKAVQNLLKRDLEPWESIVVGAVTGGLASILTTPFDVIKTRMMTAPPGVQISMKTVAINILCEEGPLALFRGAVPRFFWVAPLGAMNFAGYELLRTAMDRTKHITAKQQHMKGTSSAL